MSGEVIRLVDDRYADRDAEAPYSWVIPDILADGCTRSIREVGAMRMVYENLSAEDLRGSTLADYLIAIDADFRLLDGVRVVYEEPYFPVIELARALHLWVPAAEGGDFVFDSLSFEEPGAVVIVRSEGGWTFGSRLTPEVTSAVVGWNAVYDGIDVFVAQARADLVCLGIDPNRIFSG